MQAERNTKKFVENKMIEDSCKIKNPAKFAA